MGKRAAVQGWPFALVHAYAANTHQRPAIVNVLEDIIVHKTSLSWLSSTHKPAVMRNDTIVARSRGTRSLRCSGNKIDQEYRAVLLNPVIFLIVCTLLNFAPKDVCIW